MQGQELRVNFEALNTASKNVTDKQVDFQSLLTNIKSYNEELKTAWEGTDASAYAEKVLMQAEQMQKLSETISEIGVFLNQVNQAYQTAQESNKSAASN